MLKSVFLLALSLAACRTGAEPRRRFVDGSLSVLPQAGFAVAVGDRFQRGNRYEFDLEVEATFQFLDDNDFLDDGFEGAGNFYQLRLGVKQRSHPNGRRHATLRYGLTWLRAERSPLILDKPGTYLGAYAGFGFETDLSARWSVGPELRIVLVEGVGAEDFEVLPQFAWHVTYRF